MIQNKLSTAESKSAINLCNYLLQDNITPEEIIDSFGHLTYIIDEIFPRDYKYSNLPMDHSILIDDIMEMDSISEAEKKECIGLSAT